MEETIQIIFNFLSSYPEILSFLSPIIGGENGVIFISFLAGSGTFSIFTIFVFAFLGMLTVDSLWFFIPKTRLYQRLVGGKKIFSDYKKIAKRLEKLSHGKDILILMLSKILVGTRILVIIFIGARKMKYKRFLSVILLPDFIWTGVLILVGFLAKSSYKFTRDTFVNIQLGILFSVILIVIFYYLIRRINKWIMKK